MLDYIALRRKAGCLQLVLTESILEEKCIILPRYFQENSLIEAKIIIIRCLTKVCTWQK